MNPQDEILIVEARKLIDEFYKRYPQLKLLTKEKKMTKLQAWIVIGMLGFLCFNMLVADFIAIRFITGVGNAVSEVSEDFPTDMFSDMPTTPTDFPTDTSTPCIPDNVTCF